MLRDERGRFRPGYCGNPRGRPRKQPRETSPRQIHEDFFAVADMPVTIIENDKRKTIPTRIAINRQLTKKALEGDTRAIIEWKKAEYRFTQEFFDGQARLLKGLVETEKRCREHPEEVTEQLLQIIRDARRLLVPGFRP